MIKKILRIVLYPVLYKLGIPGLLFRKAHKNLILCYHGVSTHPDFRVNNRHMDVKQFERDILFLRKHFEIVSLRTIFEKNGIRSAKPLLSITFDDGYQNNFENVLPLAEKYNIPVTFFIITAGLYDPEFITWYDLVDFVKLSSIPEIEFDDSIFLRMHDGSYQCKNTSIEDYIKSMNRAREKALENLYNVYRQKVDKCKRILQEYWKLVSKEMLKRNVGNKWLTIGSHTHLHFNLGNNNKELIIAELNQSMKSIEEITGLFINSIAFPDGSYNDDVKNLAEEAGYSYQLAVDYRLASDIGDKRILRRYSVSNSTTHEANMLMLAFGIKKYGI